MLMPCSLPNTEGEIILGKDFELSLCTTEDIVRELQRRFRSLLIAGIADRDTAHDAILLETSGSTPEQWGIVEVAVQRIQRDMTRAIGQIL